jgi:putative heme iron utilization protein
MTDLKEQPGLGAFVEIDDAKADRDTLHLLGMREALDRWISKLDHLSSQQSNAIVGRVMREVSDNMRVDRDGVSVLLTKSALKDKSGRLEHIRKT